MMRRCCVLCGIGVIVFALWTNCRAATTQPSSADIVQSYVDRAPAVLESQNVGDIGPKNPIRTIDQEVTSSKISATQPTTQPTTRPKPAELLIVPIPSYKPTFGWGINLMLGYLFPLDEKDGGSPPSTIGAMGMYAANNTWATGLFTDLHLDQDRYRVKAGVFTGQINYSFYGIGTVAGDQGLSVPLHERLSGALVEPLFQISPNLYLGPRYQFAHIATSVGPDGFTPTSAIAKAFSQFDTDSSALGAHLEWDTRDSQFYPRHGAVFDIEADAHATAIGDSFDYQVYKITYNQYFSLSPRQVIAIRGDFQDSAGDVPFYALSQIGQGPDLRGYRPGQFQDNLLLAGQAEYRLELTDRLGAVAFAGVGEVAPNFGQLNLKHLLPSLGGGLRFTISKINHVNLRLDAAWGTEGWQGYLSIGEAY
jgi:surface antigen Omp85-like protein